MTTLDIIFGVLVLAWIVGFGLNIAGAMIHILLVLALVVLILRLLGVGATRPGI